MGLGWVIGTVLCVSVGSGLGVGFCRYGGVMLNDVGVDAANERWVFGVLVGVLVFRFFVCLLHCF